MKVSFRHFGVWGVEKEMAHRVLLNMYLNKYMSSCMLTYRHVHRMGRAVHHDTVCTCALGMRQHGHAHTLNAMDTPESSEGLS